MTYIFSLDHLSKQIIDKNGDNVSLCKATATVSINYVSKSGKRTIAFVSFDEHPYDCNSCIIKIICYKYLLYRLSVYVIICIAEH